jgi:hypothetical protein
LLFPTLASSPLVATNHVAEKTGPACNTSPNTGARALLTQDPMTRSG